MYSVKNDKRSVNESEEYIIKITLYNLYNLIYLIYLDSTKSTSCRFLFGSCSILVVDSFGKPGSGIIDGNLQWYGSFELCKSAAD